MKIVHQWEIPHTHKNNGQDDRCAICGHDLRHFIHHGKALRLYAVQAHDGTGDPDGGYVNFIVAASDPENAKVIAVNSARDRYDWDCFTTKEPEEIPWPIEPGILHESY